MGAELSPELQVQFGAEFKAFEAGINVIIARLNEVDAIAKRVSATLRSAGAAGAGAAVDYNKLVAALNTNKRALDQNSEAARKNSEALSKLNSTIANLKAPANQAQQHIAGVTSNLRGLLAGYLGVDAVMRGGKAFVDNAIEVGRYEKMLETASGSQQAYAKNTQFLESVAGEFRLNVLELGKSFSQLTTATRGTALEGAETEKLFRATAMAASALQMSTSDMNGTFRAFIQMVSKGNVQAEELRGQLGERLVGAFNMAAKAMGVSTQELNKMLKDGKVLAVDLLPKLAVEIERTFGDAAKNGSKSLGNNIAYAKGEAALFFAELAKTSGAIEGLNGVASAVALISGESRKALNGPVGELIKAIGIIANPYALGKSISGAAGNILSGKGGELFAGYTAALNPFQAQGARDKQAGFNKSNDWYARVGGLRSDLLGHKDSLRQQAEARAAEEARIAFEASNKAYAGLYTDLETTRQDAEKRAAVAAESQRKAWAIEDAMARLKIQADAYDKVIAEWENKKSRPTYGVTGPAFTSSGLKELPAFGGIDKVLDGFGGDVKSFDVDALMKVRIAVDKRLAENDAQIQLDQLSERLQALTQQFAADSAVAIGETLGTLFSDLDSDEANKRIGEVFGNLLTNIGKALIAFGVASEEVKLALESMNGWAAIAAGVVAVAAGAALKNTANKETANAAQRFWTGGIMDGPTGGVDRLPALIRPGEMILNDRQQANLFRMLNGGYTSGSGSMISDPRKMNMTVRVAGNIRGRDIKLSNERETRSRSYFGG